MSRQQPLYALFWDDVHVEKMSATEKIVFVFLFSYSGGGISGVYEVSSDLIARKTGIRTAVEVEQILARGLHNVTFDPDRGVVFVKNKLRYHPGARPENVARSIIADYRATVAATSIWMEFVDLYDRDWIGSPWLDRAIKNRQTQDLFDAIRSAAGKRKSVKRSPTVVDKDGNLEKRIDELLAAYAASSDIDAEDADNVRRVFVAVTTNRRSGKPIKPQRRATILERWAKEPTVKIARAAFDFISAGCIESLKDDRYFWGIVQKSATSWFVENRTTQDRENFAMEPDSW